MVAEKLLKNFVQPKCVSHIAKSLFSRPDLVPTSGIVYLSRYSTSQPIVCSFIDFQAKSINLHKFWPIVRRNQSHPRKEILNLADTSGSQIPTHSGSRNSLNERTVCDNFELLDCDQDIWMPENSVISDPIETTGGWGWNFSNDRWIMGTSKLSQVQHRKLARQTTF